MSSAEKTGHTCHQSAGDSHSRTEESVPPRASVNMSDPSLIREAAAATQAEHNMGLAQSLKLYKRAVAWSVLLSTAIIMEGFDIVLLANLFAYPPFQQKFGEPQPDGSYEITAAWMTGLSNGALVGEILGLFLTGLVAERYGYRWTMIGALMLITGFIFIIFFSESLVQLLIGEILAGIPWGVFQTLTTTYASDVCPTHLRAYLTTYVNLCWVVGQFIASGVLRAMVTRTDHWGYKIPFALQWMWPLPLIVGIYFAPESPWWLIRAERIKDAKKALMRLTSRNTEQNFNPDETISMMVHTNEMEKAASEGASYWDCFRGVDLRRTEIVCMTWVSQTLCGSTFMGFSTYFYQQAGLNVSNSFSMSLGQYAIGIVGTLFSWFMMSWFGRRTLYLGGEAIMCLLLLIIGFVALAGRDNVAAQWSIGSMLLVYTFIYDSTVGPVCYSLVAELTSTRLKTKTMVLARNMYNIVGIATNMVTPNMLNPTAWNWGAKAGFFWAGSCFLCLAWTYFRLPEPKGRTYGELDILFENKVSARRFKHTNVDAFEVNALEMRSAGPSSSSTLEKKDEGRVDCVEAVSS